MPINKLGNEYVSCLGYVFDECPKAVLAAIAVSLATNGGDKLEIATIAISREWQALYDAGIVPQRPSPTARSIMVGNSKT